MPEKNTPAFDTCNSCAASNGPGLGPLPSHTEVCCLSKFARPGQSALFLDEVNQKQLCEDCPSRKKFQHELPVGPVYQSLQRSSDAPQGGIVALATDCELAAPAITGSQSPAQSRKRKKIEPRLRAGFKKLTLEIRPPKFKKKLWFGTYTEEEIDRARDAVNHYMGYNQPYNFPDSPLIFAAKPLKGIKFEDLQPTCDQVIQVGDDQELAYKYFARQVKEVIHSVNGKQKKSSPKKYKCKAPQKLDTLIVPSAPGSTTSSDAQCVVCDPSTEATSQFAPPSLPPTRMDTCDDEITELLKSSSWGERIFSLEDMYSFPSFVPPSNYGESSAMEENDFLTELWAFQNEGPSFPPA